MPSSAAFLFSVSGFSTTPALSFLSPQKTVFRVQGVPSAKFVELELKDDQVTWRAVFRDPPFPPPILIANGLHDIVLSAYQLISVAPFQIAPLSTAAFAYDEPFAYPAIHIVCEGRDLHLSLLEDTDTIRIGEGDHELFVSIYSNPNGTRIVGISRSAPEPTPGHTLFVHALIESIRVSFIDMSVRETALLTAIRPSLSIGHGPSYRTFTFKLATIQLDDQRSPTAPVLLCGRRGSSEFMRVEVACPASSPFFSRVLYARAALERVDICVDAGFIAEVLKLVGQFSFETLIAPLAPQLSALAAPVRWDWLEIAPIAFAVSLRPMQRYVPDISDVRLLLPGLLISQVTDLPRSIAAKVAADYATAAFDQVLNGLGLSGRLLTALGIADAAAAALRIRRQSDLRAELTPFARRREEQFANRREIAGCFSGEALEALAKTVRKCEGRPSELVDALLAGRECGLKTKIVPGSGFGHGVFGVFVRTVETGEPVMSGAVRLRQPRAFPNGRVGRFNNEVNSAQSLLFAREKTAKERIRLVFPLANADLLVLTERFAVVMLPTGAHAVQKIAMRKVEKADVDRVFVEVKWKGRVCKWKFGSEVAAKQAWYFVETQRVFLALFGASLLA
jgi:hypothetical protein